MTGQQVSAPYIAVDAPSHVSPVRTVFCAARDIATVFVWSV